MSFSNRFAFNILNIYVCFMQTETLETPKTPENFLSVKQYADLKGTTVQAVYGKINRNTVAVKKIGSLTLVKDI